MKFTYDPSVNVAYLRLSDEQAQVDTICISEELNVDLAPDGKVYGIEFLNPNEQFQRDHLNKLLYINEETGDRSELPLTRG